ncbi:hypothetical protein GCM10009679_71120 [Saccharothrix algeriensis]|uniref:Uncharacterized protein n=2 Tax=Catellatospora bangladeshensis TaxID=310355 RepID=A0A8J3JJC0_9ACTN|nr:hypothetical protein Cba03nite_71810 [Catellatospora bangladeshensis]
MAWFKRRRRLPADMLQRLEMLGRFTLGRQESRIDSGEVWRRCLAPFLDEARADPDGFFGELGELLRGDAGGFAALGAGQLAWEALSDESLTNPAVAPFVDAGIDFKLARGLTRYDLAPYEVGRLSRRQSGT